MVRTAVPIVVAGVAIGGLSLVPALASDSAPTLPKISAADLITKVQQANTQALSGTIKVSTDLGLPSLPNLNGSGSSPLAMLTGDHTLRVAVDGPQRQRVALLGQLSEQDLVHNGDNAWSYDSAARTAEHWTLPAGQQSERHAPGLDPSHLPSTPQEFANQTLDQVQRYATVTVDGTAKVAGRPTYTLRIQPKQAGSLIREVDFGVDAATGVPLRVAVLPSNGGHAAVDARFTDVSFSTPSASTFAFTPPAGTKVTEHKPGDKPGGKAGEPVRPMGGAALGAQGKPQGRVIGAGWTSVVELSGVPGPGSLGGMTPKGAAAPGQHPAAGKPGGERPRGDNALLGELLATGKSVSGGYGSGKLFSTTLVNVLYTNDGRVFVGAVTPDVLAKAAESPTPAGGKS
jgi:outer membrane lipoprotein-sorting protein